MPPVRSLSLSLLVLTLAGCSDAKPRDGSSASAPSAATSRTDAKSAKNKLRPGADGPGCPSSSTRVKREGNKVTFVFGDAFLAELAATNEVEKECTMVIPTAPDKRSAIASFSLDGELTLQEGAQAVAVVATHVQGSAGESRSYQRQHDGPTEEPLAFTREIERDKRAFADCGTGRSLNVRAGVRLSAGDKSPRAKVKPTTFTVVLEETPCSDS